MKENQNPIPFTANDLTIQGTVLAFQADTLEFASKKVVGQMEKLNRVLVLMQCPFGIVACRFFNPRLDVKSLISVGQSVTFPVNEYRIDNGLKSVVVRS